MMHLIKATGYLMLLLHSALLLATPKGTRQPDAMYCLVCHGAAAQGSEVIGGPNLSILPDWYLRSQLTGFQQGWRGQDEADSYSAEMHRIALTMSEQDIELAIHFIKSLPTKPAMPVLSGNSTQGKHLYQSCAACHGQQAEGNASLKAPPLLGQNDWYLHKQLRAFQQGTRGTAATDTAGMLMRQSANLLSSEQDILDVISYISSLTQTTP